MRRKPSFPPYALLFIALLATLCLITMSYSSWTQTLSIHATVSTGAWGNDACIRIRTCINGSYTDPATGCTLPGNATTSRVCIASTTHPSLFTQSIWVENCGDADLTNVVVTDRIQNTVAPRFAVQPYVGTLSITPFGFCRPWDDFGFDCLTWCIGTLSAGQTVSLTVGIATLANPTGRYEPTSGDECDWQDLEMNRGATVVATGLGKTLQATTQELTLIIVDDGCPQNHVGLIQTTVPAFTPWASDSFMD